MSFRGRMRGGPNRNRGRFRAHSRDRSPSRERLRHRGARSRSRERRERFASPPPPPPPRRNRGPERGRSFERFRSPSPPRDHRPPPQFEDEEDRFRGGPRFEPREEVRFEYPGVVEMAPVEPEIIEAERPRWREVEFSRPPPQEKEVRYSPIVFEGKDEQDKPDPWSSGPPASVTIPTFGQEKSSSLIPEFNPENSETTARAFLKHLERVGGEQKWNNEDKKFHFSSKLTGAAKDWFVSGNKILDPWSQIRKTFLRAFPSDMEYYNLLDIMMKRTKSPEEDLSTYFNYKMVLLNNCKITGRKAVSCLIGGLSELVPHLKEDATEHNFATPEELYDFLKDKDVDNVKKIFQKLNTVTKKKCYRCGDFGHVAFECPQPKDVTPEKPPKHHHNLKEPEKAPKFKDVNLFGWLTKAIFDDSYPHNTIRESDVDNFKVKYKRQASVIDGCNGVKLASLGQAIVHLKVDLVHADVSVHVVKDQTQTVPLILGRAMRKYAHYIEDRNGVHFSPLEKEPRRRSPSPGRGKDSGRRSPNRHGSPQRNFKDSHPFLSSKFYGNPYS